jgi:hypothetical protein
MLALGASEDDPNWLSEYYNMPGSAELADELGTSSIYTTGLYWAFQTVTTVGYGDISPTTSDERIFCLLTAFLGTGIFCFINGEISALASQKHASLALFLRKKEKIDDFVRYYNLPRPLCLQIREFYDDGFSQGAFLKTEEIIAELPPHIRTDVYTTLRRSLIRQVLASLGVAC